MQLTINEFLGILSLLLGLFIACMGWLLKLEKVMASKVDQAQLREALGQVKAETDRSQVRLEAQVERRHAETNERLNKQDTTLENIRHMINHDIRDWFHGLDLKLTLFAKAQGVQLPSQEVTRGRRKRELEGEER